jgi:hypothetical protein
MSKRRQKITHARRRALQRCGVELSLKVHDEIVAAIRRGGMTVVARPTQRYEVYAVEIEGKLCHVVYDKVDRVLTSVKTPEMW